MRETLLLEVAVVWWFEPPTLSQVFPVRIHLEKLGDYPIDELKLLLILPVKLF